MRGLIKSALFYLSQRGVQNVFINSPEEFDGLLTEMNFKKISETFYSEALNQKVSPYVISIQEFEKKWQEETLDKKFNFSMASSKICRLSHSALNFIPPWEIIACFIIILNIQIYIFHGVKS